MVANEVFTPGLNTPTVIGITAENGSHTRRDPGGGDEAMQRVLLWITEVHRIDNFQTSGQEV